jgi:hypothetical protein
LEWQELVVTNVEVNPIRTREMSFLVQNKRLAVLDFDQMLNTNTTMFLEIEGMLQLEMEILLEILSQLCKRRSLIFVYRVAIGSPIE